MQAAAVQGAPVNVGVETSEEVLANEIVESALATGDVEDPIVVERDLVTVNVEDLMIVEVTDPAENDSHTSRDSEHVSRCWLTASVLEEDQKVDYPEALDPTQRLCCPRYTAFGPIANKRETLLRFPELHGSLAKSILSLD
jgi:hypothetical protein